MEREMCSESCYSLDFEAVVGFNIISVAITRVFFAVTKVDTTAEFADDAKVDVAGNFGLEGGVLEEGVGSKIARSKVAECSEFFSELEESLFWADGTRSPFLYPIHQHVLFIFHFLVSFSGMKFKSL